MRYDGQVARSDWILGVFPMGAVYCAGGCEASMIRRCEVDGIDVAVSRQDLAKA